MTKRFRVLESKFVPVTIATVERDPVHWRCIGHLLWMAADQLEHEKFGRCICESAGCIVGQIQLRAWHIAWTGGHDHGDEQPGQGYSGVLGSG